MFSPVVSRPFRWTVSTAVYPENCSITFAARDREIRIVTPAVRVADLALERRELADCLAARGVVHPLQSAQAVVERALEISHHLERARAGLGSEMAFHEFAPQHFAERGVG